MFALGTLPDHLIRNIARHGRFNPMKHSTREYGFDFNLSEVAKFSQISSQWRFACLPFLSSIAMFYIDVYGTSAWQKPGSIGNTIEFAIDNNAQKYVKSVYMDISYMDVVDGTAWNVMNSPMFKNARFVNVKNIKLDLIADDTHILPSGEECKANITQFVKGLNQMFPNAVSLCLKSHKFTHQEMKMIPTGLSYLVASLLVYRKDITYSLCTDNFVVGTLPAFIALTNISYDEWYDADIFAQLICLNSSTLIELKANFDNSSFFRDIVLSDDGVLIEYPNLKSLSLGYGQVREDEHILILEGAPFPALSSITLSGLNCIGNDILFRGNSQTLEHIEMGNAVNEYLLIPNIEDTRRINFPRLKSILITICHNGETSEPDDERKMLDFAISGGPNIQCMRFTLCHSISKDNFMSRLCSASIASGLVYLEILQLDLSVLDLISILKCTPNLKHLLLQAPIDGSAEAVTTLGCVADRNALARLCREYSMPRSRLAVVTFGQCSEPILAVHIGHILSLLCPRMSMVRWTGGAKFIEIAYNCVSKQGVYSEYQERLEEVEWGQRESGY